MGVAVPPGYSRGRPAVERFAADVAEGELDGRGRFGERDGGDAGELADGLGFGCE
jgi:hypothetical protein